MGRGIPCHARDAPGVAPQAVQEEMRSERAVQARRSSGQAGYQATRAAPGTGESAVGVPCQNSHTSSELAFPCPSSCSPVLADQAVDDLSVLNLGGDIDCLTGFVQRRSLSPRLVRPVLVVMPRVLGQSPLEGPFAVDQHLVQALAPYRSHIPLRKRVRSGRADWRLDAT